MRLFPKLLIGHLVPVVVVTCALVMTLVALFEMTALLQALNDSELKTLREESTLHRGCWAVDVGMRHAEMACETHGDQQAARRSIEAPAASLRAILDDSRGGGAMRGMAKEWLQIARSALEQPACEVMTDPQVRARRGRLDESLETFWAGRLDELRAGVERKDHAAKRIGDTALTAGFITALGAIGLALWLARRLASKVTRPLAKLATIFQRVGQGDFGTSVEVYGPLEIMELSAELEQMRERLAELEMLKQGFVASVSHELRTPLTKLRQALSLLRDGVVGGLSAEQERVVAIARRACEREIRMVTTLLDLSRLQAGNPVRLRSGCAIDEIIETAVEDERVDARSCSVTIELVMHGAVRPCSVDPVLLERALANLIRNAVSVSRPGQTVTVRRVERSRRGQAGVLISVIDQGPGVPADIRNTVFQAFVTSAVPHSPKSLGVGLGLALAREVATAHGGALHLDETVEVGAVFHMWLPTTVASSRPADRARPEKPTDAMEVAS